MPTKQFDLSIIIPVYNEEEVLPLLFKRLKKLFTKLKKESINTQLIFVNDGSADKSLELLKQFANTAEIPTVVINFTRNFGHQSALLAGYSLAKGTYHATIDADLQDPPELILDMYKKAVKHKKKVVLAKRISRQEPGILKELTAKIYYKILKKLTQIPIEEEVADFRLIHKDVTTQLLQIRSVPRFLRGEISYLGYPYTIVKYKRHARQAGKTKYSLKKMITLAMIGILSFSDVLPYILMLGTLFVALFAIVFIYLNFVSLLYVLIFMYIMVALLLLLIYLQKIFFLLSNKPDYVIQDIITNYGD